MRFACDVMLGKLAKYLRILGFDAAYLGNVKLLDRYSEEEDPRYLITRRKKVFGYERTIYIKAENVHEQLRELKELIKPFIDSDKVLTRCINCNVLLIEVEKERVEHRVPEFVFHNYNLFRLCPHCERVYWPGTHTEHMSELIEEVKR